MLLESMCVIYGTIRLAGQPFIYIPLFQKKKKVKLIYESLVIEGFEENTPGSRLDFRSPFRGKECGLISRTAAGNRAYPGPL